MKSIELLYVPEPNDTERMAQAISAIRSDLGQDIFAYQHYFPTLSGGITVASLPKKHPKSLEGGLMIHVAPPENIIGKGSFSAYLGSKGVNALMPAIRHAIQAALKLEHENMPSVESRHLVVSKTVTEFLFETESASHASATLLSLVDHCKVVVDFANPMPSRKWVSKKKATQVNWSSESVHTAEILLPFGVARLSVIGDGRAIPASVRVKDEGGHGDVHDHLGRLICVEIEAEMACVTKGDDPSFRLPLQLDRWAPHAMLTNPYEFVWNGFAWHVWLNMELPTSKTAVDLAAAGLSDEQADLLQAYFDGAKIKEHPVINHNFDHFLAFRRALIQAACVDLLNPWRLFQLNSASELRQIISFDKRLKCEDHTGISSATLTGQRAAEAETALMEALKHNAGRGHYQKKA